MEHVDIIKDICLNLDDKDCAIKIISSEYPFQPVKYCKRAYTNYDEIKIFIRDGFMDRYFGNRLIFPPVLRIISNTFPEQFPYQAHWKMDSCHIAYWELTPTLDHIVPIARGGLNQENNIVCTSMLHNNIKSNYTLDQVGWEVKPKGTLENWDGMIHWFINYINEHQTILSSPYFNKWYKLAIKALDYTSSIG